MIPSPQNSRTVFITGGARGIGAAIIGAMEARGHTILAPPRVDLDLANSAGVDQFIANNSNLAVDILINNAGINALNPLQAIDPATWQAMLQVNLTSALRLTQAFVPGMAARGWGRILNISSIFSIVTKERRAAYSMTKAALNALTRSVAVEYGPHGVIANALAPGYVDTALTRQNNTAEALVAVRNAIPLGRMASPDELATVAAFLVSDENTYLTGQTLIVDGGFTCQ